ICLSLPRYDEGQQPGQRSAPPVEYRMTRRETRKRVDEVEKMGVLVTEEVKTRIASAFAAAMLPTWFAYQQAASLLTCSFHQQPFSPPQRLLPSPPRASLSS